MDRVDVFRNLAVDGLKGLDRDRCSQLLGSQYDQFSHFCDTVMASCDSDPKFAAMIDKMTCSIDSENGAVFTTVLCDGSEQTVHFDQPSHPEGVSHIPSIDQVEQDLVTREEEEAKAKEVKKKSSKSKGVNSNVFF